MYVCVKVYKLPRQKLPKYEYGQDIVICVHYLHITLRRL